MSELEQFAKSVETIRAGRRRVVWPKDIKAQALHLIKNGIEAIDLEKACGIKENTFKDWQRRGSEVRQKVIELAVKNEEAGLLVTIESGSVSIHIQHLSVVNLIEIFREVL